MSYILQKFKKGKDISHQFQSGANMYLDIIPAYVPPRCGITLCMLWLPLMNKETALDL